MLPETEQYYLCAGWRWSGSGAKACVHIDGEQQYEGDTLRAALRELAKEVADD